MTSLVGRVRLALRRRWERIKPYNPRDFWEKRGPTYPDKMKDEKFRDLTQEHRAVLKQMLGSIEIESFIEVGCGSGRLFDLYADFGRLVGVDMSSTMMKNAISVKEQLGVDQMELLMASATNLPFVSGSFDCALTSEVLLHIPPDKVSGAIREISRISKYAIFLEFYSSEYENPQKLRQKRGELASWNFLHEYPKLFEELELAVLRSVELKRAPQTCFLVTKQKS